MKRNILILLSIILVASAATYKLKERSLRVPTLSTKFPAGFDSAYVEKMISLGMTNTYESKLLNNIKRRQYFQNKFGLMFMGDNEMKEFLKDNDFILADATKYKKLIPIEAGKLMIENYNKIYEGVRVQDSIQQAKFNASISLNGTFWIRESEIVNRLNIIGQKSEFNIKDDDTFIDNILQRPIPKDPIAVMKVDGGYVELANWQ